MNNSHNKISFRAFTEGYKALNSDGLPGRLLFKDGWRGIKREMLVTHRDSPDGGGNWLLTPYYQDAIVPSHPNVVDLRGRASMFVQELAELILHVTHESIGTIIEPIYWPESHAKAFFLGAKLLSVGTLRHSDAAVLAKRVAEWDCGPFISCSFPTRKSHHEGWSRVFDSMFCECEPLCPVRPFHLRCFPNLAKLLTLAWGEGVSVEGFEPDHLQSRVSLLLDALRTLYPDSGFPYSQARREIIAEIVAANLWCDTGDMRHSAEFAHRIYPLTFTI